MNCQFVKCIDIFNCQIYRHSLIKVYEVDKIRSKGLDFISVCCDGDLLCL